MMNTNHCLSLLSDALIVNFPKGGRLYAFVPKSAYHAQLVCHNQAQWNIPYQAQKNIFSLYKKQGIYYFKPVDGRKISEVNPVADVTKILRRD